MASLGKRQHRQGGGGRQEAVGRPQRTDLGENSGEIHEKTKKDISC
jgi:hypothetical protein